MRNNAALETVARVIDDYIGEENPVRVIDVLSSMRSIFSARLRGGKAVPYVTERHLRFCHAGNIERHSGLDEPWSH